MTLPPHHHFAGYWFAAFTMSIGELVFAHLALDIPVLPLRIDWTVIVVAAVATLPPTLVAIAALIEQRRTKHELNHRLDELLSESRKLARLEGHAEGMLDERAAAAAAAAQHPRQDPSTPS